MEALKSKVGITITTIILILILLIGGVVYIGWYNLFREVPTYYESPEEQFKYGSIGTENVEGIPYWIWVVLPRLFPEKLPGPGGYTSLGLTWEEGKETPIGVTKKTIGFPRQGINCAVCHHATYRIKPEDKPVIVLGAPSNKLETQSFLRFLFACVHDPKFNADNILSLMGYIQPLSWFDRLLYRFIIIPQTKQGILRQEQSFAWMDSRPDWGPGRMDFNPVKFRTLDLPLDDTIGIADIMPLWNQGQHQGFAYHWDGLQTSLKETVYNGSIGNGATPKSIPIKDLQRVEDLIKEIQPPKFPFPINQELADKGHEIFDNSCASCHALRGQRTGTVIAIDEIGTDPYRLDMWTQQAADAYNNYTGGDNLEFNEFRKTNGYLSVSLEGLWLRAPYLHNGSVPYLTDLLEVTEKRTSVFWRGYDVYNPEKVGFIAEGAEAEKVGFKYDTQVKANGNQGHLYGTDLSSVDKKALLEYLKTL